MALQECVCECSFRVRHVYVEVPDVPPEDPAERVVAEAVAEDYSLEEIAREPHRYLERCNCECRGAEVM